MLSSCQLKAPSADQRHRPLGPDVVTAAVLDLRRRYYSRALFNLQ
jgi:hypothetical protein